MDEAVISRTSSSFSRICISEPQIYGPTALEDEEVVTGKEDIDKIRWELLGKIKSCYGRVKLRAVFDEGFCFGLLDPVSNIVAGVLIARAVRIDPDPMISFPRQRKPDPIEDIDQRSLNGLVAFLAALFPYLTEVKAMWYLNKAELDPLVAARLIIQHRGMEQSFGFSSDTTVAAVEAALRCAAAAAQHPCPKQLVSGWKILSHFLDKVATVLSGTSVTFDHFITDILLSKPQPSIFSLEKSWDLASSRLLKLSPDLLGMKVKQFSERSTLRRMLLTTIHGYYLQALARLPKEKLRSQYHHSLLQAGHCYGPLDPVSNIMLNTIWYTRAYPLAKKVDLEAISSRGLLRIAVRSLHGLVSFMCTRHPMLLSPDEAMQRLHAAGADLRIADPIELLDDDDDDMVLSVSTSVERAYAAAAAAALHPNPCDQAELLSPPNPMLRMAWHYLKDGGKLSSVGAHQLAEGLFYSIGEWSEPPEHPETSIKVLNKLNYTRMDRLVNKLWSQHAGVVQTVKYLIDVYNRRQPEVPKYELHVVCGVNVDIDGPVCTAPFTGTYRYSHINFLATQSADEPATLFFAECRNDNGSTQEMGWCCPVAVPSPGTEQVRCLYCEYNGSKIVHPTQGSFHGCGIEFEKMWGGEGVYSECHTNDSIIKSSRLAAYWVDYLEDDCIYSTYGLDDKHIGPKAFIRKERFDHMRATMLKKGLAFTKDMEDAIREHTMPLSEKGLLDDEQGMVMDFVETELVCMEDDGLS